MAGEKKRYNLQVRTAQKRQRLQVASAQKVARYKMPMAPTVNVVLGELPADVVGNRPTGAYVENRDTGTIRISNKDPYSLAHEVGHLVDMQVLTDGDRNYFQKLLRAPNQEWYPTKEGEEFGSPMEWFADYYAHAVMGYDPRKGEGVSSYARVNGKRLRKFKAAMDRLRQRGGLDAYQERY